MRALTLHEPWATLIWLGAKTIETRGWATAYRGPLLIHAGERWGDGQGAAWSRAKGLLRVAYAQEMWEPPPWSDPTFCLKAHLGHALCVTRLADCRPMAEAPSELEGAFGSFGPGCFGWVLEDVCLIDPPVPWPGAQGLWPVPELLRSRVLGGLDRDLGRWVWEAAHSERKEVAS